MRDKIRDLLDLAITAPSGDNCQPWRFAVKENSIELHNDPNADTSYYNYRQRASLVSHGAVLETIAIAAPTLGLKPVFRFFPNPDNNNHVATIRMEEALPAEVELAPYIESRTTNRKKYSGRLLDDTQSTALIPEHKDLTHVSVFLANTKEGVDRMAEVICLSDRLVFEHRPLHDFLFEHIRWSEDEAIRLRDGLDIKTLELNAMDTMGFKLLRNWGFTSFAAKLGATRAIAGKARKLTTSASAVGMILGQGRAEPITYLEGGRLMQRIWLQATRMGLSFHPMTGISFLMQRVAEQQAEAMSEQHQNLVKGTLQTTAFVCNVTEPLVLGIFRVGSSAPPSARSIRKELSQLLI